MFLSVIIPTRNRSACLYNTLLSLTLQTLKHDEFEVIVIDNGSTDDTEENALSFKGKLKSIKYYYDERPGLHVGRHRGMQESHGDILVYADDDIEAFPTWLEGVKDSFEDSTVALVGGKILPKFESEPPAWLSDMWNAGCDAGQVLGYLSILDLGDGIKEINPYYVFGCNFSIKKSVVLEAGGFHPDGMPAQLIHFRGDGESHVSQYILQNKYKVLYNPKASVYHLVTNDRMTVEYFCKRAFNQGISDSYTEIRHSKGIPKSRDTGDNGRSRGVWGRFSEKSTFDLCQSIAHRIIDSARKILTAKSKSPYFEIDEKIRKAYRAGREFHLNKVKSDPTLLDWVLRPDYMDEQLKG